MIQHRRTNMLFSQRLERFPRTEDVPHLLVLAQLRFANQAGDLDLDADDPLEERVDEAFGTVAHAPRDGLRRFVPAGQPLDDSPDVLSVVADGHLPMGVRDDVVPGGNLLVAFVLAGIPVGRYIGLPRPEDDQHLVAVR